MRRIVGAMILMALAGTADAQSGWVYPGESYRDATGQMRFPTSDGQIFDSVFEREAYLRQNRDIHMKAQADARRARQLEREAAEAQRQRDAVTAPVLPSPGTNPDIILSQRPGRYVVPEAATDDELENLKRRDRALRRAYEAAENDRRQQALSAIGRAGGSATRADIAGARAARSAQIARGTDRLQAGAAAERATLGERELRPQGPLIRMPVVE